MSLTDGYHLTCLDIMNADIMRTQRTRIHTLYKPEMNVMVW